MAVMICGERRAGEKGLDASRPTAITSPPGRLLRRRPRELVVTPLARDRVRPDDEPPADSYAASHPGPENDAEDRLHRSCRTVGRFRQSKTVGVIGEAHRAAQLGLQVLLQRAADQPC